MGKTNTGSYLADSLMRFFLDVAESKVVVACNQQWIESTQHHPCFEEVIADTKSRLFLDF
jgi:hypothetical protein